MRGGLGQAVRFLTVLPFPGGPAPRPFTLGPSLKWFPLVGAGIGALTAAVARLSGRFWPPEVAALLGLAAAAAVTGGLHLDALADVADGMSVPRTPEATRRVMSDPRLGALGAIGLLLHLALKWALLSGLLSTGRLLPVLAAAGALSRWSLVLTARHFPCAPGPEGMGKHAAGPQSAGAAFPAAAVAVLAAWTALGFALGSFSIGLTLLAVIGLNRFFVKRLGGITGDTLGAAAELTEAGLWLLCLAWLR